MNCPMCGEQMFALLTSMACPRACEKVERGPYCPECGSNNTERFEIEGILDCFDVADPVRDSVTYHCWPCGEVWNIEAQKPETD
jgi:transposase